MSGPLFTGEWFRIRSGEHEGRWHLGGWQKTAVRVLDGGDENGWLGLWICPRCNAVVFDAGQHTIRDSRRPRRSAKAGRSNS